ncbi:uncharacterized protein B0I36DRAFT_311655 [Microdochium trichocladiopsis]|uniref:Uncharacterized protein n=1 Tax=Microdochium trichocladiopsis TaxID=1682393 RepID=A0A9P8YK11_9PEZI|nr:uncharacterized protein B0I36DRAFT_311655 [Microdochium trichocladiopsis]KAH7040861.1 hypothetical protein B0I36DRAFT_311655 [Microdochium trichocladiopsis]
MLCTSISEVFYLSRPLIALAAAYFVVPRPIQPNSKGRGWPFSMMQQCRATRPTDFCPSNRTVSISTRTSCSSSEASQRNSVGLASSHIFRSAASRKLGPTLVIVCLDLEPAQPSHSGTGIWALGCACWHAKVRRPQCGVPMRAGPCTSDRPIDGQEPSARARWSWSRHSLLARA